MQLKGTSLTHRRSDSLPCAMSFAAWQVVGNRTANLIGKREGSE